MLRILVICTANICRSPMGEYLLKEALKGHAVEVDSAGIHGQHGIEADSTVVKILEEQGVTDIRAHKSKPVVSGMSGQYDLYLCMEQHHLNDLTHIIPSVTGRAYLFGHWANQEIADPHKLPEAHYRLAHEQITKATQDWLEKLPLLGML